MTTIVNTGRYCQVCLPTGDSCIRTITSILRRYGYAVSTSSMGWQVTRAGKIKMTLIDIRPGSNGDTYFTGNCNVSDCIRSHSAHLGDF